MNAVGRLERIPVNGYFVFVLVLVGMGFTIETMDTTFTGLVAGIIIKSWSLPVGIIGLFTAMGPAGYLFGAGIGGGLSDKFGRRSVFLWTLVGISVFSGLRFFVPHGNWELLGFLTAISWFFSGAETAVGTIYMNELITTKYRGTFTGLATGSFAWGLVLGTVLSLTIVVIGWRYLFLYTSVTAFAALILRPLLPESPRWLEAKGRLTQAENNLRKIEQKSARRLGAELPPAKIIKVEPRRGTPFMLLWSSKYRSRTAVSWIAFFGQTAAYYGFFTWIYILLASKGLTIEHSVVIILIAYVLGAVPGNTLSGFIADRIGRKKTVYAYLLGGGLSAAGLAASTNNIELILFLTLFAFFLNGAYPAIYTYVAEMYPTLARNTGLGAASAFSRIGAIFMPLAFAAMFPIAGFGGVFALAALSMAAGGIVIFFFGTETGKVLLERASGEETVEVMGPASE